MADCTTPTPTCKACCASAQLMQLSYRVGCIAGRTEALSAVIAAYLHTPSPAPTPPGSPSWFRDIVERAELVPRAVGVAVSIWRLWRTISWPASVTMWGALAARWLGWL